LTELIWPVGIMALAVVTLIYCGSKTVADFRTRRSGLAVLGATITILAPAALGAMGFALFSFIRGGGP